MIDFPVVADDAQLLDPDSIADDLGPSGAIARAMQQYEDRPAQRDMARTIAMLYNDTGVGLIEAGTGVGKSPVTPSRASMVSKPVSEQSSPPTP